jgi:hypothetical protein
MLQTEPAQAGHRIAARGYGMSQSRRAMIECIFGWGKQHGTMRKSKHRGLVRVAGDFLLNHLIRLPRLPPHRRICPDGGNLQAGERSGRQ